MKKIYATISIILTVSTIFSQTPNFEWAESISGSGNDRGTSIVTDVLGNVYITGFFGGTADFDPGTGTYNLTSAGQTDIFVQKLDNSGNLLWAKSMGGTSSDEGHSVTIDVFGDVYITGAFRGTADFDPGAGTNNLTSAGSSDIFIQKLDDLGNLLWVKQIEGISYDVGQSITTDVSGNVYITGFFEGTADFDPGAGTYNLSPVGSFRDVFVQKLDALGNFVWAKSMGGTSFDEGHSIITDAFGNVFTTGYFIGTVDFDPGIGTSNLTSIGGTDVFIQKLDASGNLIWAIQMGGIGDEKGHSITIGTSGDIYTTGYFSATADFDPGIGTSNLSTSLLNNDIFIQKIDPLGNLIWAKQMGGINNSDHGYSITTDASENVFTTGYFFGVADFDPGVGTYNLVADGGIDIYIQKLDVSGNFIWAKSMGGTSGDEGRSITLDNSENIFTTGHFESTVDFDPGVGVYNLTSFGPSQDIFAHKMNQCVSTFGTDVMTACDSHVWIDGITYTSSNNIATHTLTNVTGCDSVVTLNLSMSFSNTGTDVQTACDTYTWMDGNTYTASNSIATHTLTNLAGCDSVVTLNLSMSFSNTGTDVQTACDTYTWIDGNTYTASNSLATHTLTNIAGCDSMVTLNLSMSFSNTGTDIQTACDSYTWIDGNTYTANNNSATHTLTNLAGCDSILTLDLTINTVNSSVTQVDALLTADESGATYQWLECPTMTQINGATSQSYTATANGGYAVIVTVNGCSDTSACYTVTGVGIIENDFGSGLLLYPNPTDGCFSIDLGEVSQLVTVTMIDLRGKVIQSKTYNDEQLLNLKIEEPAGVYLLVIESGDKKAIIRLVKE